MKTRIQARAAFKVAGVKAENITAAECPAIWNKLYDKSSFIQLEMMGNGQSYGLCYGEMQADKINYMAAYNLSDENKSQDLGLDILSIPESEYLVISLIGAVPDVIHQAWKYIMEDYFPNQGYQHAGSPDFELYSQGDIQSPDYRMELWVPIVKC